MNGMEILSIGEGKAFGTGGGNAEFKTMQDAKKAGDQLEKDLYCAAQELTPKDIGNDIEQALKVILIFSQKWQEAEINLRRAENKSNWLLAYTVLALVYFVVSFVFDFIL